MFTTSQAFSSFAVDDIAAAKAFYADTLGMNVTENQMGFLTLELGGGGSVMIYDRENHTPAAFTVLHFQVDDVDSAVDDLVSRGVSMLRYDGFDQNEKGIASGLGPPIAWFTDPAGNVLGVVGDVEGSSLESDETAEGVG